MSDFSDKINELLSNPDSLAKIMQIAQNLGVGQAGAASPTSTAQATTPQADNTIQAEAVQTSAQGDTMQSSAHGMQPDTANQSAKPALTPSQNNLAALGSLLSSGGAQNLLGAASSAATTDKRIALLNALRPFISEAKQKRVDNVISAITISSTLGKLKGV